MAHDLQTQRDMTTMLKTSGYALYPAILLSGITTISACLLQGWSPALTVVLHSAVFATIAMLRRRDDEATAPAAEDDALSLEALAAQLDVDLDDDDAPTLRYDQDELMQALEAATALRANAKALVPAGWSPWHGDLNLFEAHEDELEAQQARELDRFREELRAVFQPA